jgi:uncharacterized membrane protein
MSLKHFHTVFIVFAILCDAGFWYWTHVMQDQAQEMGVAHLGVFAGWLALGLIGYGGWYVFKKSKTIFVDT